jgi:hypothetical protein
MQWDDPFGEQEDEFAGDIDEQTEEGEVRPKQCRGCAKHLS